MKYAFYPGCSAKGTCRELYYSTVRVAKRLGIDLVELNDASCCGAGVVEEADPNIGVAINARTFAQAEKMGLDTIMTICGTCQGVMHEVNNKLLTDDSLYEETNKTLESNGGIYKRSIKIKHMLWLFSEEEMIGLIKKNIKTVLNGLKIAPFYGCHILRPSKHLGFDDPEKPTSIEKLIQILGGEPVEYRGKLKCCGFPVIIEKEDIGLDMIGKNILEAKEMGADCVVTPCPLCHMNLDLYQKEAEKKIGKNLNIPILHLPQLIGLAIGMSYKEMMLSRHMISSSRMYKKIR